MPSLAIAPGVSCGCAGRSLTTTFTRSAAVGVHTSTQPAVEQLRRRFAPAFAGSRVLCIPCCVHDMRGGVRGVSYEAARHAPDAALIRRRGVPRAEPGPVASKRLPSPPGMRGRRGGEQLLGGRAEASRRAGGTSLDDCRRAIELAVSLPRWVGVAGFDRLDAASSSVDVRRPPAPGGSAKEECLNAMSAGSTADASTLA